MSDKIDLRISGSSTMPGGEYGQVRISGAGRVQGALRCDSLGCSGAAKVLGDVDCAGEARCSGAVNVEGALGCGSLHCDGSTHCLRLNCAGEVHASGSLVVEEALGAGQLDSSGSLQAGSIRCGELQSSGRLKVGGDVEAEQVRLSGAVQIPGLLNAEAVDIRAGGVEIGSIGGSSIRILPGEGHGWGIFRRSTPVCAQIGTIEGDDIELDCVQAQVVRGRRVRIGAHCRIGRVEYSECLDAQPGTVEVAVHTGAEA